MVRICFILFLMKKLSSYKIERGLDEGVQSYSRSNYVVFGAIVYRAMCQRNAIAE